MENIVSATLPLLYAIAQEDNIIAYLHDGVHIVAIDNGADAILLRNVLYQLVNNETGLRVQS
jgi:hypothetical protein